MPKDRKPPTKKTETNKQYIKIFPHRASFYNAKILLEQLAVRLSLVFFLIQ